MITVQLTNKQARAAVRGIRTAFRELGNMLPASGPTRDAIDAMARNNGMDGAQDELDSLERAAFAIEQAVP